MSTKNMPDVALEKIREQYAPINWVGMGEIEIPLWISAQGQKMRIPAKAVAKVSLDKQASRGIHMSRLYTSLQDKLSQSVLSLDLLKELTQDFLTSHQELSSRAFVSLKFEQSLLRKALKSEHQAWRNYPVQYSAMNVNGQVKIYLEVLVTYSSTCPASAALARQLIQNKFSQNFSGDLAAGGVPFEKVYEWLGSSEGIVATPHAQRSFARVKIQVRDDFSAEQLIDLIEEALQTPVQGAVKREDEQEFALRNGQNLMFCEDAARRIKKALDPIAGIVDYIAEMNHVESLHPHSAVSLISKGLELSSFE